MDTSNGQLGPNGREGAVDIDELAAEHARRAFGNSRAKQLLRKVLLPVYKPTRSVIFPNLRRAVLAQPAVFEAWYRARAWRYLLTRGMKGLDETALAEGNGFLNKVSSYNRSQLWEWHRVRTEKLTAVLRCISDIPERPRILVIGPRNEAEVLLMSLYGFPFESVEAIDIFSYSPLIKLQDMHELQYADGTFDVVYSAWTLPYAYDMAKVVREIRRVLKPRGIVAAGYSLDKDVSSLDGHPLPGSVKELQGLFAPDVDWVFWQEALPLEHSQEITTVFRVTKSSGR